MEELLREMMGGDEGGEGEGEVVGGGDDGMIGKGIPVKQHVEVSRKCIA